MTWSRLALGFSGGASEYVCSSQLPPGGRSSLALRILPCVTKCEERLVPGQMGSCSLLPRMEIHKALRKGASRETDAQDPFFKKTFPRERTRSCPCQVFVRQASPPYTLASLEGESRRLHSLICKGNKTCCA